MNNQEEVLLHKSTWNSKRFFLVYWIGIMFLGTGFAIGVGTTILNPKYSYSATAAHPTYPGEWHPEDCSTCHSAQVEKWNQTAHSTSAIQINATHVEIAGSSNVSQATFDAVCGHCMATGWDNSTGTVTYWDYGVTCAGCHETPGETDHTAENCGKCHTGDHHPQYPDYNKSAHKDSYTDLLGSDHAGDACLHCMSGQGLYTDDVALTDTNLTGVSCATCHDPHDAANELQLRKSDITELCGECHGTSSRHTTYEVFTDTQNKHKSLDCTTCHGYELHGDEASVNHTWEVTVDSCGQCHTDNVTRWATMEEIQGDVGDLIAEYETQLTNVTAKADEANTTYGISNTDVNESYILIDEAKALIMFVESDMSMGFHNPTLVKAKVNLALTKLDQAYVKADSAKGVSTPGFDFISILAAISFLGIAILLKKKRR
ncbi:MAG: multiheme c-type cytochrome [Candidatus Hodarchaeales archaeon]|jgi:predicted CXXCH cytochrome family protein